MHELTIIENILNIVKNNLKNDPSEVKKIFITLGVLSGIEKNALLQSFAAIKKNHPFTRTKLIISENKRVIFCPTCKKQTKIQKNLILKCRFCGKRKVDIIKGKEMTIDKIEKDICNQE